MLRNLSRRGFLGAVGAAVAAPAVVSAAPVIEYARNTTGIVWCGWRDAFNQNITVGFWSVKVPPDARGRDQLVATTLGRVQRLRGLECIDLSIEKGWPILSCFSTAEEKDAAKARALDALCEAMHAA